MDLRSVDRKHRSCELLIRRADATHGFHGIDAIAQDAPQILQLLLTSHHHQHLARCEGHRTTGISCQGVVLTDGQDHGTRASCQVEICKAAIRQVTHHQGIFAEAEFFDFTIGSR